MELDAIHERRRVAEHRRDALANHLRIRARRVSGRRAWRAANRRSMRRPRSAVIISMRRLTSIALSVASRCAASSKACTDDRYERSVTADSGTTDKQQKRDNQTCAKRHRVTLYALSSLM